MDVSIDAIRELHAAAARSSTEGTTEAWMLAGEVIADVSKGDAETALRSTAKLVNQLESMHGGSSPADYINHVERLHFELHQWADTASVKDEYLIGKSL